MSRDHRTPNEVDEVARRLAPLARAEADVPTANAVFWRARARLTIDESTRRRRVVLRPLRVFQRAIGAGAVLLGTLISVWPLLPSVSPGAGLFALPLLAATVILGAFLLAETAA